MEWRLSVKVGDLVVYDPTAGFGRTEDIYRAEGYGLGIILDENPHYYFINWTNLCTVSPMLATNKENVLPATVKNVERIRELAKREKELDKWAVI
tara:strand:+ start:1455 stop:1739 length:285 start_codon:yes stop_codon:yes gene_type:complete